MENWDNISSGVDTSDAFDIDHGSSSDIVTSEFTPENLNTFHHTNGQDIFNFNDPLKYINQFVFEPLNLDMGNTHIVQPHFVDPYIRQDGTLVDGYYRDGDGNTEINRTVEQGGGYNRSNPDGNPLNNLNSNR